MCGCSRRACSEADLIGAAPDQISDNARSWEAALKPPLTAPLAPSLASPFSHIPTLKLVLSSSHEENVFTRMACICL